MFKNFYKSIIDYKIKNIDLFNYLGTAEKYGKMHQKKEAFVSDEEPYFYAIERDKHYVAFYKNLFFNFSMDREKDDQIAEVFIKNPDEEWVLNEDETPKNTLGRVYLAYNVDVLGEQRCYGHRYVSGAWNKEFWTMFSEFDNKVSRLTELNQLEAIYSKR